MVSRRNFLQGVAFAITAGGVGVDHVSGDEPARSTPVDEAGEVVARALEPIRDRRRLPGLIGGWARADGRLQAVGAVGVRKQGAPEPFRETDRVHLGSDTKAMTATMIGTLIDEGTLDWSSTVAEVFPDHAQAIHPDYRTATLWQFLTHRAGVPANGPWRLLRQDRSTTEQRRSLLAGMLESAPLTKPGTTTAYSNLGYALAGLMAEQATGRSWEDLMRRRLFEPLEMSTAGFGPLGAKGAVDQPWGHVPRPGSESRLIPLQEDNAPALGPAGTVHCSLADWARFAGLHLRAAQGTARLLKPETFHKLHTPPSGSDYAGGWVVTDRRRWTGGRALTHSGSNTMWFATIWVAPARDLAVLAATNAGGDDARLACDEAVQALMKHEEAARRG